MQEPPLPDYFQNFRTKNTIPACFRETGSLPDRLAVVDDRAPATKVVNLSYERQKKIESKRATENAIQKVAAIAAQESTQANKEENKQITTAPEADKNPASASKEETKLDQQAEITANAEDKDVADDQKEKEKEHVEA